MILESFLTAQQQATVVDAVRLAEKGTSGEIRIHIDRECKTTPVKRAEEVFNRLGMHKTAQRNGVLIYVAVDSKVFAIIGDKASTMSFRRISGVTSLRLWATNSAKDTLQKDFAKEQ